MLANLQHLQYMKRRKNAIKLKVLLHTHRFFTFLCDIALWAQTGGHAYMTQNLGSILEGYRNKPFKCDRWNMITFHERGRMDLPSPKIFFLCHNAKWHIFGATICLKCTFSPMFFLELQANTLVFSPSNLIMGMLILLLNCFSN